MFRRIEIRFACAEAAHINAFGLHRFGFAINRQSERRSQLSGAFGNFHGGRLIQKWERTLLAAIEVFNQRFEIILVNLDDCHFAFRVLNGIRGMRGVDHDRLAKFAAN